MGWFSEVGHYLWQHCHPVTTITDFLTGLGIYLLGSILIGAIGQAWALSSEQSEFCSHHQYITFQSTLVYHISVNSGFHISNTINRSIDSTLMVNRHFHITSCKINDNNVVKIFKKFKNTWLEVHLNSYPILWYLINCS